MFSWRMLTLSGDAKYADMLEKVIYNSLLAAVDLKGERFFYCNPLVWRGAKGKGHLTPVRWSVHNCYCCPPQVARTIAKLHNWVYSVSDDGLWVHLYGGNVLTTRLPGAGAVKVTQETGYPWNGRIKLTIDASGETGFAIRLRIPGWSQRAGVKVNGKPVESPAKPGAYLPISRKWRSGDTIELDIPMPVRLMEARREVKALRNYVSVMRGPIVYCLELPEAQGGGRIWKKGVFLPENAEFTTEVRKGFFAGNAVVLSGYGLTASGRDLFVRKIASAGPPKERENPGELLYRRFAPRSLPIPSGGGIPITLIPYYAWANRGPAFMEVWIPLAR